MTLVVAICVAALALTAVTLLAYTLTVWTFHGTDPPHCDTCRGSGHLPLRYRALHLGITSRCPTCQDP